jgi:hypothetical protein
LFILPHGNTAFKSYIVESVLKGKDSPGGLYIVRLIKRKYYYLLIRQERKAQQIGQALLVPSVSRKQKRKKRPLQSTDGSCSVLFRSIPRKLGCTWKKASTTLLVITRPPSRIRRARGLARRGSATSAASASSTATTLHGSSHPSSSNDGRPIQKYQVLYFRLITTCKIYF